jgi:uncharacterized secreted protein with C-terminal beta-propeller domain
MTRIAILVAASALAAVSLGTAAPAERAPGSLTAFPSCGTLLEYAKTHAEPFVTAYGFGQRGGVVPVPGVAAPQASASTTDGASYSETNVQEAGVDEPDLVKTNGRTLFAVENGRLESVRVGGTPKLLDTLTLPNGWSRDLLLAGDHLLVLSRAGGWAVPLPAQTASIVAPIQTATTLTEVDVSDPSVLRVLQTMTVSGAYLAARMIGSSVRLVTSTPLPDELPFTTPTGTDSASLAAATAKNRAVLTGSRASAWLPTYRLGKRAARPLVQCRSVRHPASFSGLGMLTVTTIDLAKSLAPVDATAVMTDGRIVYASPTSLYVATERWSARPLQATPTKAPGGASTEIHEFDISSPSKTRYVASGSVPGYLLDQWSLSESGGVLRVVSTDAPAWMTGATGESESFLTTLRPHGGTLARLGQVGGIGKGERVYAVRMVGDTGYVVTFRQVDPLFVLDLHDPAHPVVRGKLELPGYSAYLHPIDGGLLLGLGENVDAKSNEPSGTQVSLFDVSDPAHPARVAHASLGQGWSSAESDHHAFLYWPATGLVVVPFGQQAVAMQVTRSGVREVGRLVQVGAKQAQLPQIDRTVVVGQTLLTVSNAGVEANGLSSLLPIGFARFPSPPPVVTPGGPVAP